jgi:lipopolysaccharide transport system ATP-binding protein
MLGLAIRAEGLSKRYRIGQQHSSVDTLRDHLAHGLKTLWTRGWRIPRETIWALRDVSFEVREGEVVGIIGRNGAGKTTLLRILSRITEPTAGHADIRGRVGSLLEVGTGFHAELTGRENVFLNGAILGMRRSEIVRKFDEIVEFSGIEKFIDTPVKRYSSGMYVRLAFAVSAHLEPEILIVDEVLAVGDVEFQKRCLGKMESFNQSGRTVLFVSHSMPTIARLCPRLILLDRGRVVEDGPTNRVIGHYLHGEQGTAARRVWPAEEAPGDDYARLRSARVVDSTGATADVVDVGEEVGIELAFDVVSDERAVFPWIDLYDEGGNHVFSALDTDPIWSEPRPPGRYTATAWIPPHLLNEGQLHVTVSVKSLLVGSKPWRHAEAESALTFQVVEQAGGPNARGDFHGRIGGPVRPLLRWTSEAAAADESPLLARPARD